MSNETCDSRAEPPDANLRLAAHDLRQHFHVFEIGLQLLDRQDGSDTQRAETIQLMKEESQRAKVTLDAFLKAAGITTPLDRS